MTNTVSPADREARLWYRARFFTCLLTVDAMSLTLIATHDRLGEASWLISLVWLVLFVNAYYGTINLVNWRGWLRATSND